MPTKNYDCLRRFFLILILDIFSLFLMSFNKSVKKKKHDLEKYEYRVTATKVFLKGLALTVEVWCLDIKDKLKK